MPLLELRQLGVLLDHLLRPGDAVRNAQEAASAATRDATDRRSIEREIGTLNSRG